MAKTKPKSLTLRQARDLDIQIGFLEGLIRRDSAYSEALEQLADAYLDRGRVVDGLQIDRRLASLRPADPQVRYNLACSLTLAGQIDIAASELEKAVDLGFRDFQWLAEDPDLALLREQPVFRRVQARIQQLTGESI